MKLIFINGFDRKYDYFSEFLDLKRSNLMSFINSIHIVIHSFTWFSSYFPIIAVDRVCQSCHSSTRMSFNNSALLEDQIRDTVFAKSETIHFRSQHSRSEDTEQFWVRHTMNLGEAQGSVSERTSPKACQPPASPHMSQSKKPQCCPRGFLFDVRVGRIGVKLLSSQAH